MLVFKSGNENSGTKLISYLLGDGVNSVNWNSPFVGPNSNWKDVSHISVYYTPGGGGNNTSVPEPATLLGLGLVGSAMFASRRRKSASC